MPTRPRTAARAAAAVSVVPQTSGGGGIRQWDTYAEEAAPDVEPWRMQLPDGRLIEVPFPNSDAADEVAAAQLRGDSVAAINAVFGEHAPVILELTAKQRWTLRIKLVNDVMLHFGMSLADPGESEASSH